jgi:hypothetical protein
MKKEFILWAVKIGQAQYMEEMITSNTDLAVIEKARTWAEQNGFDRLRVSGFNWEMPDFTATINKK